MALRTPGASSFLSPSSSTFPSTYDVFLSFRGEDTRFSFTDHLHAAFKQMGFIVFKDDEKLKQGSTIAEELLKAIKESRYAVIVISETFASSKWCLKELSMIMESRKIGLEVLPVFYHVNPSDVRKLKGIFVQAFDKHRGDPEVEEVEREAWRATLKELGGISGWHIDGSSEATVVEKITAKIFYGLFRLNSSKIFKNLVGIDSNVEKLVSSLCLEMDDIRYIGIHGMGGVSKTTVAEVLYETICFKFEAHCLIYGKRNDQSRDIEELQQEVIHKILKEDNKIWNHYDGTKLLAMRLCNKKVLIVFDDINKDHLEALAGSTIWFGGKSRIIITSRDCQFWKPLVNDDNAYEIKPLNQKDALQRFCWEVFGKPKPEEKFVKLSKNITKYCGGLPLAIKVIGSSLVGKGIEVWNSTCDFLEENLHAEVSKKLEISYRELDIFPKQLFLDIACLFNGMDAHRIIPVWESLDCHPKYCIDILRQKSLLELSWCRQFHMHNLLQKMGQQIVYNEDLRQPGRRSRLWYPDDISYVLNNKSGTKVVEGIVLNLALQKQERLSFEGFSKLTRLKVLVIRRKESYSSLNFLTWFGHPSKFMLSKELRLLEWTGYPLISLPINFQFDNLIELRMPYSRIKQLWSGKKNFDKLKYINLSHSDLMEIDLGGVPNIEEICLENCRNLRKVQLWSRRKNLNKLKYIDLSHSDLIEMSDLSGVPNVEKINLEFCRNLRKVHHSIGNLKQLRYLSLFSCKKLERLPKKINLKFLEWLDLCHCSKLKKFPEIMGNMTSL